MQKHKIKFLIPNPEEDCYGWWWNFKKMNSKPKWIRKAKCLVGGFHNIDFTHGIHEQEYAVSRGWA